MSIPILDVHGIGQSTVAVLAEHGIKSTEVLARTTIEQLSAVPGFSASRSAQVISDAQALLASQGVEPAPRDIKPEKVKKEKKAKKAKKLKEPKSKKQSKSEKVKKKSTKKDKGKEKSKAKSKKKKK